MTKDSATPYSDQSGKTGGPTAVDRKQLFALAGASFAIGTEAYVYVGHLGALSRDLQVGIAQAGMLAAAFAVTYAVSAPISAALLARADRRTLIVVGLMGVGLLNLAAALTPNFAFLMIMRIGCGLAAGLVGPASSAVAATLAPPEQRGQAMAVVLAGLTLAFILGIPLGSVIGAIGGWRSTFAFAGILAMMAAVTAYIVLPPLAGSGSAGLRRLAIGLRPDILATLAMTGLGFAATFTVIAYIQPVALRIGGFDGAAIGGLQALIGVGSIVGIVIGGRYADRPSAMMMVAATFLVSVVALSGYSWLMRLDVGDLLTLPILATCMVTGAAGLFARSPAIQTRLVSLDMPSMNVLLALNGSMVFAGQGLGAAIGSITIYTLDESALGYVAAMVAASGALLALSLTARPKTFAG
jgi:MFS transporter, DHA1 family, inner membrane transport protein